MYRDDSTGVCFEGDRENEFWIGDGYSGTAG